MDYMLNPNEIQVHGEGAMFERLAHMIKDGINWIFSEDQGSGTLMSPSAKCTLTLELVEGQIVGVEDEYAVIVIDGDTYAPSNKYDLDGEVRFLSE